MDTNDYVNSKDGTKLLGTNSGRFFYYVKAGDIRKETGAARRGALYKVSDILKVRAKLSKKHGKKEKKELTHGFIDWIKDLNDVLTALKLDYLVYGEDVQLESLSYYTDRVKRNPRVALAMYDTEKRENILAYICLLPVPEPVIVDILSGKRHETSLTTEEVENYERLGSYTLLAESIVSHPDHIYAFNALLNRYMDYWCDQYPDRYVTKIYAQAASHHGDVLIQKLYFAPLYHLARNAFMLDLERPGASRFIRHFQQCLKEKGWEIPEAI